MEQFYHVYPLGYVGANMANNDGYARVGLKELGRDIDHIKGLGTTVLLLGPVFESGSHGYDTTDYRQVDRRLGTNEDLKYLIKLYQGQGIKVMLDCVFNHIGRNHDIFLDLQKNREASSYTSWVKGLDFGSDNSYHDGFSYETWDGHELLVKLDQEEEGVKSYLIETALYWQEAFQIDGLRIDAADVCDKDFLACLSGAMKQKNPEFIMLGEVVHGDYRDWLDKGGLTMVTNYEAYKGLYSSFNDVNFFEIAYSLNREFGNAGIYPKQSMMNFVDNHDVNRIASTLKKETHLYPLHILLFTMPGHPSIYYGSEFAAKGLKARGSDEALRPAYHVIRPQTSHPLAQAISRLSSIRKAWDALRQGGYHLLSNTHDTLVFRRYLGEEEVIVAINAREEDLPMTIPSGAYKDLLNHEEINGQGPVKVYGNWGRILLKIG